MMGTLAASRLLRFRSSSALPQSSSAHRFRLQRQIGDYHKLSAVFSPGLYFFIYRCQTTTARGDPLIGRQLTTAGKLKALCVCRSHWIYTLHVCTNVLPSKPINNEPFFLLGNLPPFCSSHTQLCTSHASHATPLLNEIYFFTLFSFNILIELKISVN